MNKKGHSKSLVASHPGNLNAMKSGAHSPRLIQARAEAILAESSISGELDELGRVALAEVARLTAIIEAIDRDLDERGLTDTKGKERYLLRRREGYSRRLLETSERVGQSLKRGRTVSRGNDSVDDKRSIVADRARGLSWSTIASRHGLSEKECQSIWNTERPSTESLTPDDLRAARDEILSNFATVVEDLVSIYETTDNDAVRLRSVMARLAALNQQTDALRAFGLLPRSAHAFRLDVELRGMFQTIFDVFEKYGVPLEAQEEIVDTFRELSNPTGATSPASRPDSARSNVRSLPTTDSQLSQANARSSGQQEPRASSSRKAARRKPSP